MRTASILVADFDGDGDPDIAKLPNSGWSGELLVNDGAAGFATRVPLPLASSYYVTSAAGDVVGSPLVDIVEYDDPYDAQPTHLRWSENTTPAVVPYGSSCGGLALAGAITAPGPGRLTLTLQGAPPFALGALVFGTTRFELPLPPTGCPLRTEPLVVLPIPDGSGRASLGLNLPGSPVTANVQGLAGAGSPVPWATSPGLGLFVR